MYVREKNSMGICGICFMIDRDNFGYFMIFWKIYNFLILLMLCLEIVVR